MPINFPNWANLQTQSPGMGDIFENIIRGAQLSNQPRELRNKNQQAEEMIRQLLLGNEAKEVEGRYREPALQHKQKMNELEAKYKPDEYQQKFMSDILSNKIKTTNLNTLGEMNNAKLAEMLANAEKIRMQPTEEEKKQTRLQEFMEKENIKRQNKVEEDLSKPTKAVITANQNIVNAVNNVIPQIEGLKKIKTPNVLTGKYSDPDVYADYEAATDSVADSLMASFKWLGIQASLEMAKGMTKRKLRESETAYHKRLDKLIDELKMRQKNAYEVYSGSNVKPNERPEKNEPIEQKKLNGKTYYRYADGWHDEKI